MKPIDAIFHSDPAHGWLQVPKRTYLAVGYAASAFSYQDEKFVYLEEDCDAPRFIKKAEAKGLSFTMSEKTHNGPCFIRNKDQVSGIGFTLIEPKGEGEK